MLGWSCPALDGLRHCFVVCCQCCGPWPHSVPDKLLPLLTSKTNACSALFVCRHNSSQLLSLLSVGQAV